MLHNILSPLVENWFAKEDCTARPIIDYILQRGFFRDAQIEAIKTYLFLKIEGGNKPLHRLLAEGFLTRREDLSALHISQPARDWFEENTAARSLYEYSRTKSDGKSALPELENYLKEHVGAVNCNDVIRRIFYGVEYSDYLFSLPMGAGKTFLMAAFIYLDLYFAQNEPDNETWAHNFLLLVPSGLKSSILPSLKTIEHFDPTTVLPEPAASHIHQLIRFEMLDQPKSAKASNKTRSPNAVKISSYQPFENLMGLVMVTNAEKVVLDRMKVSEQGQLIEDSDDEKDRQANELRNLIGKVPNLQILIDEVHHAATDDIKLRQVVNNWNARGNINGVLGFSGTPYLSSAEKIEVSDELSLKFAQITNTVFYYPLTRAIEKFLKKPTVVTLAGAQPEEIVRRGVQEFLKKYGDKKYASGQTAKLAIYCGSIERLEEEIYPMLLAMKISPDEILKYHRGNKTHPAPADAESEFRNLDQAFSNKKIILLVQIGKEGWDCRSLTGVVLSQKGDCPTNMVLQTSCRCLRQMDGGYESAAIWMNSENAKILDKQLKEEQQTSIAEINKIGAQSTVEFRPRIARAAYLKLPPVEFYQLSVRYEDFIVQEANPSHSIAALDAGAFQRQSEKVVSALKTGEVKSRSFIEDERGETVTLTQWLQSIVKGSCGALRLRDLRPFENELRALFNAMTREENGVRRWNDLFAPDDVAARVRLAFAERHDVKSSSEAVPQTAHLLIVEKLKDIAKDTKYLFPSADDVATMQALDAEGKTAAQYSEQVEAERKAAQELLKKQGFNIELPSSENLSLAVQNKERSFHYAPYKCDSSFEIEFLQQALTIEELGARHLEIYFNGEGELTEFRIECYAQGKNGWNKVGIYTPDFLVIARKDGAIHKALIIETKGEGYAQNFKPRRKFVEGEFLKMNNEKFGYKRFDFLYLEGAMNGDARFALEAKVKEFFAN